MLFLSVLVITNSSHGYRLPTWKDTRNDSFWLTSPVYCCIFEISNETMRIQVICHYSTPLPPSRPRKSKGPSCSELVSSGFQGGKTFCASFCASLIAGSRRAFLCVDRVRLCLFVGERVLAETEWNALGVNVCFSKSLFTFVCGFCSSSLENYFGLGTTDVKAKTDHSVSLSWNNKFWAFPKRRVLIVHSIYLWVGPGCLYSVYLVNTFSLAQIYSLCRTSFILLFSERTICAP